MLYFNGNFSRGDQPWGRWGHADEVILVSQTEEETAARPQASFDQRDGENGR
jgi:hypothetical protein